MFSVALITVPAYGKARAQMFATQHHLE